MPVHEYACSRCGELFEVLFRSRAEALVGSPACPACAATETERLVSSFALGNRVEVGPGRSAYPYTWEQVQGGHPDSLAYWRRRIQKEMREEQSDPELVLKREEVARRRFGQAPATAPPHSHGHGHPHAQSHGHPHGHAREAAPSPAAGETSHDAWRHVEFVKPRAEPSRADSSKAGPSPEPKPGAGG